MNNILRNNTLISQIILKISKMHKNLKRNKDEVLVFILPTNYEAY